MRSGKLLQLWVLSNTLRCSVHCKPRMATMLSSLVYLRVSSARLQHCKQTWAGAPAMGCGGTGPSLSSIGSAPCEAPCPGDDAAAWPAGMDPPTGSSAAAAAMSCCACGSSGLDGLPASCACAINKVWGTW